MDYKKDIKDIKDTSIVRHTTSSNGMVAFGITISKKCERLATAVYLVTDFLSDSEPLKYRLRTLSVDFVRDASFVKNGSQMIETNVLEGLRVNILETLSLLELAFIAGLISEMNFTILKREYVSLRDSIEVKKSSRESRTDSILGDSFFAPAFREESVPEVRSIPVMQNFSQGLSATQSVRQSDATVSNRNSKGQTSISAEIQKDKPVSVRPLQNVRAITDVAKESRRTRILKLVKDNREVTIKDIATHFSDLSEKTIQRELVSLVESGVLKKFGERRWSRYTLVS